MIGGMHTIFYSKNAEAVRAFFRDVLGFPAVDAGHGWLIFAAPPAEVAVHPEEKSGHIEVYLMCKNVDQAIEALKKKGVEFAAPPREQGWGRLTHLKLPDGQNLGLYEPHHPMAIRMSSASRSSSQKKSTKKAKSSLAHERKSAAAYDPRRELR